VTIGGITREPDEIWMMQVGRNLTAADGFLRGIQHVILDRDPLYTAAFRRLLRDSGVSPLVLPAWSPNLNAFAERFVESAKFDGMDSSRFRCGMMPHQLIPSARPGGDRDGC